MWVFNPVQSFRLRLSYRIFIRTHSYRNGQQSCVVGFPTSYIASSPPLAPFPGAPRYWPSEVPTLDNCYCASLAISSVVWLGIHLPRLKSGFRGKRSQNAPLLPNNVNASQNPSHRKLTKAPSQVTVTRLSCPSTPNYLRCPPHLP